MALLSQQELLESPPSRRIIVPKGRCAWYGVDPSTVRTALAGVSRDSSGELARWVETCSYGSEEGAVRLSGIYTTTRDWVRSVAACCPWPGVVFVEQPSGQQENPQLSYAVGVILAAVYDGLWDVTGGPTLIETVPSASWKKRACGRGNIYKPTRKKLGRAPVFEDYGVAVWARANGYGGSSYDESDAWGIAEAARRSVALEER